MQVKKTFEPKIRKFVFQTLFSLTLLISIPGLIHAQGFNGLVGIVQSGDGNWFYYDVYGIKVEKLPTHKITVPIFYTDKNKNLIKGIYKINCETEELQIDDKFVAVKNTDNVGDRIVKGLCGFKQTNATWVHYFTFPLNSEKKAQTLFINIEKLENVFIVVDGVQKEGISVDYTNGLFNKNTLLFEIMDIRNFVVSCSEEKLFQKENDVYTTVSVAPHFGSGLRGSRHNLCSVIYANLVKPNLSAPLVLPKKTIPTAEPKQLSPIDNAKAKCIELGFKSGTEQFGKCVLQLSK